MAYNKHTWVTDETVTADNLNNMEGGIYRNDANFSNFSQSVAIVETGEKASAARHVGQWILLAANGMLLEVVEEIAEGEDYEINGNVEEIRLDTKIKGKIDEPESDGSSGQVLATNGSGERYWKTVAGGSGDPDAASKSDIAVVEEGTTASAERYVGDIVYVNGYIYRVTARINTGGSYSVGTNIERIVYSKHVKEELADFYEWLISLENNFSANNEGKNLTASRDYQVGEWIVRNSGLYKVIANITEGAAFTSSNISSYKVNQFFHDIADDTYERVQMTNSNIAPNEGYETHATVRRNNADIFIVNGYLYQALGDIEIGEEYRVNGNILRFDLCTLLQSAINNKADTPHVITMYGNGQLSVTYETIYDYLKAGELIYFKHYLGSEEGIGEEAFLGMVTSAYRYGQEGYDPAYRVIVSRPCSVEISGSGTSSLFGPAVLVFGADSKNANPTFLRKVYPSQCTASQHL